MLVATAFERVPLLFENPEEVITCNCVTGIARCFAAMESRLARGYYLAGFFSYEAGYAFEPGIFEDRRRDFPLLSFGCYRAFVPVPLPPAAGPCRVSGITPTLPFERYRDDIARIRAHIAAGDVYQITYCLKLKFSVDGDPRALYRRLLRRQPVPYPAYIQTPQFSILSLSPELFVKKDGTAVVTKPMKGTWPRGGNPLTDILARLRFSQDEKNRAENVMITDLLRNDLGRIGTDVAVERLCEVSSYASLFQMTSTVAARAPGALPLYNLFAALFPSGSVTGAPKLRAMEIIRDLEPEDRRIYTGAIGYITPDRKLFFNVPIRTILVQDGRAEMGIGGGIIWDSTPEGEWAETWLKARFLTNDKDTS